MNIHNLVFTVVVFIVTTLNAADFASVKSPALRGGDKPLILTLDVKGVERLRLTATGYSWGQAAWCEPVLTAVDGSLVKLSDLKPVSTTVGWGEFMVNQGPDNKPLKVGGREFVHGIFAHADSVVEYDIGGKYTRFDVLVGVNVTAEKRGAVVFQVADAAAMALQDKINQTLTIFTKERVDGLVKTLEAKGDLENEMLSKVLRFKGDYDNIVALLKRDDSGAFKDVKEFSELSHKVYTSELNAPLLFVKRHAYMAGHIYDDYLTWRPGGGIYVIENPSAPMEKQILRAVIDPTTKESLGEGVYRDPEISYDGKRVLFAFKGSVHGSTSIYEIGVDGTGLRRVTTADAVCGKLKPQAGLIGSGHHDITPCYLPNGRIVFTSTRTGGHVMCFSSYIDTLHTMNADGSDLKAISVNNQNEFDPVVMPDGRIMYGRWEYVDKTALYMQSLWVVNPDGSNETAVFANNMAKPTALLDARPVPGSRLVVTSLTPHNGQSVGAIAMIDPAKGKNSVDAIFNFTPEYTTLMDQGLKHGPSDPWPLSKDLVLIANNAKHHGEHGVLEIINRYGGRSVIHRESEISCYSPMLIKSRPIPPIIPSMIKPGAPGRFLVHDIYQGLDGIERGSIKWIRVLETTSRVSGIPKGGRWWNQAFLVSWQGSYDIKNFLGIVPVEEDGSAYFEAPVGKALYFQALDKDMKMVQSQRTFVQAVSGITRSCMGCHIKEDNAAPINYNKRPLALGRSPQKLKAESWGEGYLDYPKMVQPVLDKHCVSCHGGTKGIAAGVDLSGGWTWAFSISYETLLKNTLTGYLNCNNGSVRTAEILDPLTHGSGIAPLSKLLHGGHNDRLKEITKKEKELLFAWMDGNCNYYGSWDYSEQATCDSILSTRAPLIKEMKKAGCVKCHQEEIGSDWVNLDSPEMSRILRAPMSDKHETGLAWCRGGKASKVAIPLVTKRQQPPDVFRVQSHTRPEEEGEPVITFAGSDNTSYQAMLKIIREARMAALKKPRVDMPGADIIKGKCRELVPISPPVVAEK